jgi:hypothetical protein
MKRTIYLIYDTIKKGYCSDRHGQTGDFTKATIYLTEPNTLKSIKERAYSVKQYLEDGKPTDKSAYNFTHSLKMFNEAVRRSKIPNYGYEVVPVEMNETR